MSDRVVIVVLLLTLAVDASRHGATWAVVAFVFAAGGYVATCILRSGAR